MGCPVAWLIELIGLSLFSIRLKGQEEMGCIFHGVFPAARLFPGLAHM